MGFLKAHFEKLILGLVLISVVGSCFFFLHAFAATRSNVEAVRKASRDTAVGEKPPIPALTGRMFTGVEEVTNPRIPLKLVDYELPDFGDAGSGAKEARNSYRAPPHFMQPAYYIMCINYECLRLVPYDVRSCPFCGTELPPDPGEVDKANDKDGDGIPDFTENQFDFLNPENPADARCDYDKDTFTNIEEFALDTPMADPEHYPPLAENLRFLTTTKRPLPIKLRGITTYDSADPAKWAISVVMGKRSRMTQVGKTIANQYRVEKATPKVVNKTNPKTGTVMEVDASEIVVKDRKGNTYILVAGKTTYEQEMIGVFQFLMSRYSPSRCPKLSLKLGQTIPLRHRTKGDTPEVYRLTELNEEGASLTRLDRLDPDGTRATFDIRKLDRRQDFIKPPRRRPGPPGTRPGRYPPGTRPKR